MKNRLMSEYLLLESWIQVKQENCSQKDAMIDCSRDSETAMFSLELRISFVRFSLSPCFRPKLQLATRSSREVYRLFKILTQTLVIFSMYEVFNNKTSCK